MVQKTDLANGNRESATASSIATVPGPIDAQPLTTAPRRELLPSLGENGGQRPGLIMEGERRKHGASVTDHFSICCSLRTIFSPRHRLVFSQVPMTTLSIRRLPNTRNSDDCVYHALPFWQGAPVALRKSSVLKQLFSCWKK